MTTITEQRLRWLFQDRGFRVHEIRRNKHWWAKVARQDGGPQFGVAVALTPSDVRFMHRFDQTLKRAEREARTLHLKGMTT